MGFGVSQREQERLKLSRKDNCEKAIEQMSHGKGRFYRLYKAKACLFDTIKKRPLRYS